MADTARAATAQKQHRRPGPRIVPAIPYRLSKSQPSARPITPDGSTKDSVAQPAKPQPEPQSAHERQEQEQTENQQAEAVQTPLTPESNTSGAEKRELDATAAPGPLQNGHSAPADTRGEHSLPAPSLTQHVLNSQDAENHVNGHADEKPPAPVEPSAEPKPVTNGVHRKLTIPAHLPPPFYPSNKTDTQTPPTEGSDSAHTSSHRHQLSAGALVFQSANESPAPPVAPQEPELHQHEQHALPRPPPGFGPQQFAPFFPGHAQHPSEAGAPWHVPPQAVAPPEAAYANGSEFRPSQFPSGPVLYPGPPNGHFSPEQAAFVANGTRTSHSQSPSKAQFGDTVPTSDHGDEHHAMPYQNGTAPPTERLEESPFELASYLSIQFANPEFADFILQVRSPESILMSVPVHGIVVVRSPVIAEAIRRSPAPSHRSRDARRLVDVLALDPFTTGESLEEAVRVLYGAPLLSAQTFLFGLAPYMYENDQASPSNDARMRMRQVLSYIAAARTLQMPSMQARGIEIARMLLRWDTVEQVLQYTLQASSGPRSRGEGPDAEDPFISMLLNHALEFIAYTFPADFKLYAIAPEFSDAPRLPALVEPRNAAHNPRLSKIRFGDAPPEDDHRPSHATVVLSTILLSLPLPLVERLFNHRATANQLGWSGATKILREVVNERENRRQKASAGQLKPSQDGTIPAGLLNNVYLEERVEQVEPSPLHPSGHRLATKRVASDT
ncbi:hypothetical protein J4E81_000334 [Alternaria sp. BMP 2799]|nr:hypothetical protein J4E81_000334 [Alternaria sp. BMP 2799]